ERVAARALQLGQELGAAGRVRRAREALAGDERQLAAARGAGRRLLRPAALPAGRATLARRRSRDLALLPFAVCEAIAAHLALPALARRAPVQLREGAAERRRPPLQALARAQPRQPRAGAADDRRRVPAP